MSLLIIFLIINALALVIASNTYQTYHSNYSSIESNRNNLFTENSSTFFLSLKSFVSAMSLRLFTNSLTFTFDKFSAILLTIK